MTFGCPTGTREDASLPSFTFFGLGLGPSKPKEQSKGAMLDKEKVQLGAFNSMLIHVYTQQAFCVDLI